MLKLPPWLLLLAALFCVTGSVDLMPARPLPQTGDGHAAMWGVCSAPPSLLPALSDRFPALRQASEYLKGPKRLVETWMPGMMPLADRIHARTAPRLL